MAQSPFLFEASSPNQGSTYPLGKAVSIMHGGMLSREVFRDSPPPQLLRVFGTRRSGNHAILRWLVANISVSDHIHFDQVRLGFPIESARSVYFDGLHLFPARPMSSENARSFVEAIKRSKVISAFYEEQSLGEGMAAFLRDIPRHHTDDLPNRNVVVYREFLNWLASAYNHPLILNAGLRTDNRNLGTLFKSINHWCVTVMRAKGEFSSSPFAILPIYYDHWINSDDYRQRILESLQLSRVRVALPEDTGKFGRGSSFSGIGGRPNRDELVTRWVGFRKNDNFKMVLRLALQDERLVRLLATYFPNTIEILETEFNLDC